MKHKRFLILLTVLVFALIALVACSNGDGGDVTTTLPETEAPDAIPEAIEIKLEGEAVNFSVIRPDEKKGSELAVEAAKSIREAIGKTLGSYPELGTDFLKKGDSHDAESLEILVGMTNYEQTAKAVSDIATYGDYIIKPIGNKIVIAAYSESGYRLAVSRFVALLEGGYDAESGVITLSREALELSETSERRLAALPMFEGGAFRAWYDAGNRLSISSSCDEVIIDSVTPELYSAYLAKLEANGYEKYADHKMGDNLFATYKSQRYTVNVGYYAYESAARVLIEPLAPDAPKKAEYQKVTTSQLTMLGLQQKYNDGLLNNGLSAIIRLEDGRFIVIDGGVNTSTTADDLIKALKSQAKEYTDKPVVAAWIITHSHSDHAGLLHGQYSTIGAAVKIESIMANFVSDAEANRAMNTPSSVWGASEGAAMDGVIKAAGTFGATMYKVHVGQVYNFADASLEILYTLESYAPEVANNYNTTSTVIKMTFGGKTTVFNPGDATGAALELCSKMYGDYLKSDILFATHHGYITQSTGDSGVKMAYGFVAPTLVLWPHGVNNHSAVITKDWNTVLFSQPNYKEGYIAGAIGERTVVKLPYSVGDVTGPNKSNG